MEMRKYHKPALSTINAPKDILGSVKKVMMMGALENWIRILMGQYRF